MISNLTSCKIRKIAKLAHIRMEDAEVAKMVIELNHIFDWIEQLNEVDISGVEPFTADMPMKMRDDVADDGGNVQGVLSNAPDQNRDFFAVPRFVKDGDDE